MLFQKMNNLLSLVKRKLQNRGKDHINTQEMNYHILKSLCCARTGCFGDAGCSALEGIVLLIDKHNKSSQICVHSTRKFRSASFHSLLVTMSKSCIYMCLFLNFISFYIRNRHTYLLSQFTLKTNKSARLIWIMFIYSWFLKTKNYQELYNLKLLTF